MVHGAWCMVHGAWCMVWTKGGREYGVFHIYKGILCKGILCNVILCNGILCNGIGYSMQWVVYTRGGLLYKNPPKYKGGLYERGPSI